MSTITETILVMMGLALLGGAAADNVDSKQLLEQLCRLNPSAPQVKRISELQSMAALLEENNGSGCDSNVVDAIKRLVLVVEPAKRNVCLPESIDAIMDFYDEFVSSSKSRSKMPKSLEKFFYVYGLQVSKRCRKLMIDELHHASERAGIDNGEEYHFVYKTMERVKKVFGSDIPIENLLGVVEANKLDRMGKAMISKDQLQQEKFYEVRDKCNRKYTPVYDVLIIPVVRLAAIGINYKAKWTPEEMVRLQKTTAYTRWFVAVLICESNLRLKPTEADSSATEPITTQNIVVAASGESGIAQIDNKSSESPNAYPNQILAAIDDLVFNERDFYLMKSLAELKSTLSEMTQYRIRMATKMHSLLLYKLDWLVSPIYKTARQGIKKAQDGINKVRGARAKVYKVHP